jgi:hypothetical protein
MTRYLRLILGTCLLLAFCWTSALAAPAPLVPAEDLAILTAPYVEQIAHKYPGILTLLAVVGALRLVLKPIMTYLHQRAEATADPEDDLRLEELEKSLWFCALAFLLDYTASIKLRSMGVVREAAALALLLAIGLVPGCARFSTSQSDIRYTNGVPERAIRTRASSYTFFDSQSGLTRWKATQTDKSQGASVGSLNQESSGTNAVQAIKLIGEGAAKALVP